jgi:hypothetical protein
MGTLQPSGKQVKGGARIEVANMGVALYFPHSCRIPAGRNKPLAPT